MDETVVTRRFMNGFHSSLCFPPPQFPLHCNDLSNRQRQEIRDNFHFMSDDMDAGMDPRPVDTSRERDILQESSKTDYEPWILVSRRWGRGGGHGGAGGPRGLRSPVVHAIFFPTS